MTNPNGGERLDRIETLLEQFIAASVADRQASNERLTRIEQVVESNNRFLESFSQDLKQYTDSMNNFATRIEGIIAANNQDRQETNSRLAAIQRQVAAIALHLGVT
jgi:methyl-accepting chemotaxis protein